MEDARGIRARAPDWRPGRRPSWRQGQLTQRSGFAQVVSARPGPLSRRVHRCIFDGPTSTILETQRSLPFVAISPRSSTRSSRCCCCCSRWRPPRPRSAVAPTDAPERTPRRSPPMMAAPSRATTTARTCRAISRPLPATAPITTHRRAPAPDPATAASCSHQCAFARRTCPRSPRHRPLPSLPLRSHRC